MKCELTIFIWNYRYPILLWIPTNIINYCYYQNIFFVKFKQLHHTSNTVTQLHNYVDNSCKFKRAYDFGPTKEILYIFMASRNLVCFFLLFMLRLTNLGFLGPNQNIQILAYRPNPCIPMYYHSLFLSLSSFLPFASFSY